MMAACGGLSEPTKATGDIQSLVESVKSEIEEKLGYTFDSVKAIEVAKQVVAGTNYFVKIQIRDADYIHARIFKSKIQFIFLYIVINFFL